MIPVIMAGGSGTRLWPLSRTSFPKQFLKLGYEQSMLQQTLTRLKGLTSEKPIVITNEEHRFLVAEQLRQLGMSADILLEPVGKNTAPAIALAAFQSMNREANSTLLILAADHVIDDTQAFQRVVQSLQPHVEDGMFGTLGIVPTEAATGYGYIKATDSEGDVLTVDEFVEKPDLKTAESYVKSGRYYWNSGMFLIRADRYLEELEKQENEIFQVCKTAMSSTTKDLDFIRIESENFMQCPDNSIDYALMEPLCNYSEKQIVVAPLDAGWSDVGSWSALWDVSDKCENGNSVLKAANEDCEVILQDTTDTLISTSDRMIATLGVENLIVVDTKDALLIANKDKVQDVKQIVSKIKLKGGDEYKSHREVYRPWGKYESIDHGQRYQVKRISVQPGAKLSVQMHHHRAEHWIVVSGTAKVTNGDETFILSENQSTYIPIGQVHCLENPGKVNLEMIEVQSGSYLGEDDIVRLEDMYGRTRD